MRSEGVERIGFSSTAAVYAGRIRPADPGGRPNLARAPYGTSKLAVEHLLEGYAAAYGIGATALRYFSTLPARTSMAGTARPIARRAT